VNLPVFDGSAGEVYARLTVDRLDNWGFPRMGSFARAEFSVANDALGAEAD